jgi:hypothetical protein
MRIQIEVEPDQNNWELFCQEPELTKEEWATWYELAAEARENDEVADFIESEAADEITDYEQKRELTWPNVIRGADAHRRYKRAVIAAWEKWQTRRN